VRIRYKLVKLPTKVTWVRLSLLCVSANLWAQSLQILPRPANESHARTFQIMLFSPKEAPPASLQWRISVTTGSAMAEGDIKPSIEAADSKKELYCAAAPEKTEPTIVCIIAGAMAPIPNGPVAVFRVAGAAGVQATTIRVYDIVGATAEGESISFPNAQLTVKMSERAEK